MNQQVKPSEISTKVDLIVLADSADMIKRKLADILASHQSILKARVGQLQVTDDLDQCKRLVSVTRTQHTMPMVFVAKPKSTADQIQQAISQLAAMSDHGLVV